MSEKKEIEVLEMNYEYDYESNSIIFDSVDNAIAWKNIPC